MVELYSMENITYEQLNKRAQEAFENKKSLEIGKQDKEQLTFKEEKIKQKLKQITAPPYLDEKEVEENKNSISNLDERAQLTFLTKLCFTKGPNFAIKVAQGLSDSVLDSLHAVLVEDETYNKLKEENII